MTINTLLNEFENITLDPLNRSAITPVKTLPSTTVHPISPDDSSVSSTDSPAFSRSNSSSSNVRTVVVSEHKKAEMEGRHAEEPLLKENPGRFVLFPIKEPEVSLYPLVFEVLHIQSKH